MHTFLFLAQLSLEIGELILLLAHELGLLHLRHAVGVDALVGIGDLAVRLCVRYELVGRRLHLRFFLKVWIKIDIETITMR